MKITYLSNFLSHEEIISPVENHSLAHGLKHRLRVLILSILIAQRYKKKIDFESLVHSALYHDIGRKSDLEDGNHGSFSLKWIKENFPHLHPEISTKKVEKIALLCQQHSLEDGEIEKLSTELKILKDADALDRLRFLPFSSVNVNYLRTPEAKQLLNEEIPQKLIKATRQLDFSRNPEKKYKNFYKSIVKLNLPITLPFNLILKLKKIEVERIFDKLANKRVSKKAKKVFTEKEIKLLILWFDLRKNKRLRKQKRKEVLIRAYEKTEVEKIYKKLNKLSRQIDSKQKYFNNKLVKNNGEVVNSLRLLKNRFPKTEVIKNLHRSFLNHFIIQKTNEGFLFTEIVNNPNISREYINPNIYLRTNKLSKFTKLIIANQQIKQGIKLNITELLSLINRKSLRYQTNRLTLYQLVKNLDKHKLLNPTSITILKNLLLTRNKIFSDVFYEKNIITIAEEINPYINFYFDQQERYKQEVVLLTKVFCCIAKDDSKLWNTQLFPILLNRYIGNLDLLENTLAILKSKKLQKKWKFILKNETINRKKYRPYYKTAMSYINKKSKHNYELIMKDLATKNIPKKVIYRSDFDNCINIKAKNLANIIHGEQKFVNNFTRIRSEQSYRFIWNFLKPIFSFPRLNTYKETVALIRQPNRSYDHPIYGYLERSRSLLKNKEIVANIINRTLIRALYGRTNIILKKDISKRAVYSLLDTTYPYRERQVDFEYAKKLRIALDKHFIRIHYKFKVLSMFMSYVEAKYLGGVTIHDFAEIRIPLLGYLKHKDALLKLKKEAPEVKIKILYPSLN